MSMQGQFYIFVCGGTKVHYRAHCTKLEHCFCSCQCYWNWLFVGGKLVSWSLGMVFWNWEVMEPRDRKWLAQIQRSLWAPISQLWQPPSSWIVVIFCSFFSSLWSKRQRDHPHLVCEGRKYWIQEEMPYEMLYKNSSMVGCKEFFGWSLVLYSLKLILYQKYAQDLVISKKPNKRNWLPLIGPGGGIWRISLNGIVQIFLCLCVRINN